MAIEDVGWDLGAIRSRCQLRRCLTEWPTVFLPEPWRIHGELQAPRGSSADERIDTETLRECTRNVKPTQLSRPVSGIDVGSSEAEFAEIQREMSALSQTSRRRSRTRKAVCAEEDVEKAATSELKEPPFDLESTLRGNRTAEIESGIRPKYIGVLWDGLVVKGTSGTSNFVKTFPDAFLGFFNVVKKVMLVFTVGEKGREANLLNEFRGVASPGEMVLVLGRPGSGCTTFLKTVANQRYEFMDVGGEVLYGPFDAETFARRYRGEAVYNQEYDAHHPTLTVSQTLKFALDTKTPGKRPHGISKVDFKEKVVNMLLKVFNIEHIRNTTVGRISGGERKRLSIAEMMVTSATVCAWDNSTRGLDASTALDYAKSLRVMTSIYKTTTFVSLYQASENIYEQFDKVLVIDAGRQVYFGPAREARSYFEGLGFKANHRQTTPDFLTGCTDEFEREYATGSNPQNAPHSPDSLAKAFLDSKYSQLLNDEMYEYRKAVKEDKQRLADFTTAILDGKHKAALTHSAYSTPYYVQVWVLMQRQYLIKWQDKFSLIVRWTTTIGTAIIFGTLWWDLPKTSAGAFTRGGLLFSSLMFNTFQAFSELIGTMIGRPIVKKHKAYTFYHPSALWIAQIIIDSAFSAVVILAFSIIVYLMCGLVREAGAFFTFYLVILSSYLAMTALFRTIGCLCSSFDYALKFASIIIEFFVITCGYLIQFQSGKTWLRWIYWINPLGLGFSALMENEFSRLTMTCTDESLIPSGPGYTSIENQVCTLPGSIAGTNQVSGSAYVVDGFSYNPSDLWRNVGIILGLIVAYLVTNAVLGEWLDFFTGGGTRKVFQRQNQERIELNSSLFAKMERRRATKKEIEYTQFNVKSISVLTWEGLNYDIPTPDGPLRLLNNVYGYVKPGELTALMGASGAGKTTLLDVLSERKNIGVITGDILVDGLKPSAAFQRATSYAEQLDVHEPTQTVREALRFSANLRQPFRVPQSEKFAYVEEILSLLEMEDVADAIIGEPGTGLSAEQRKRVTIGVELAAKPELLLFLDEPTSGLDSQSAFNIIRFLKKLAAAGQSILCTIHQPNAALFGNFDRLLLLQRGGHTVYFGEIGKDACILLDYFRCNGAYCPPNANPAEWILDTIGAGQTQRIGDRDWCQIFNESPQLASIKSHISQIKAMRLAEIDSQIKNDETEYATPLSHQLKIVQKRTNLSFWRSPHYGFTRLFNHIVIALSTGLAYLSLDNSRASLQYRVFVIYQVTVLPSLILAQVEPKYDSSRLIFYREASSKMYSQFVFASSLVVAEMPYSIFCAIAVFLPMYYMPGFQNAPSRAGYQFLMVLITELFSVTLSQTLAALTPSPLISALLNPFIVITFGLFCGVTIPKPQIPKFWSAWLYYLDPFTHLVGGMVVTELHGRIVECTSQELQYFTAPAGQTCGEYMSNFFEQGGAGYIVNNATSACGYCAYRSGEQFYSGFNLTFDNRWRDLGIFTAFVWSNLILLFFGSRYLNFNRR